VQRDTLEAGPKKAKGIEYASFENGRTGDQSRGGGERGGQRRGHEQSPGREIKVHSVRQGPGPHRDPKKRTRKDIGGKVIFQTVACPSGGINPSNTRTGALALQTGPQVAVVQKEF